ncbi:MAG: hypothetical protein KGL43_11570 [Burkholderiales bacterium]|nr:hypothetical protein [Burkholderiales bacterium]
MSDSLDFPLAPNAVDRRFQRRLLERMSAELNDAATAATEVSYLTDVFFSFELPASDARSFNAILAFGFGNRASGSSASPMPLAGPVNAAIAEAVFGLWRRNPLPVYAQWEVAQVLAAKYPQMNGMVWSLSPPVVAPNGSVSSPSLDAVVSAATALASASALGKVAVVSHRDLAKLAIQTARAHGLDAWAA